MSSAAPDFFPDILHRWRSLGLVTVEDVSRWTQTPESSVHKWFSGEREPSYTALRMLAREAARAKGLTDIAASLLTPAFEVCRRTESSANGSMDDEVADLTIAAGQGVAAHRSGDVPSLDRSIEQAEGVIARMKAERDRLAASVR